MQREFVDVFRYMRDVKKPTTPTEAEALDKLHAPQPPSKAHLKRLARAGHGLVPEPRRLPERSSEALLRQEWAKAQWSQLGGTRTIASANGKPRVEQVFLYSAANTELKERAARTPRVAPGPALAPATPKTGNIPKTDTRLKQAHILAMSKLVYSEYEPDMLEVIEAFGSIEAYNRALGVHV